MARRSEGGAVAPAQPAGVRAADRFEQTGFALLLGVLALRPLVQESHSAERVGITAGLDAALNNGPIPTLVFGAAICAAMTCCAAAAAVRRGRVALGQTDVLMLLVGAGCVASCAVASNRRLALTGATDFVLLLAMGAVLARLIARAWQVRLVLAVIVASAAAFALEGYMQHTRDFAETIRQYEEHREQWWARQGVPLDAPDVQLFERRLYAREVSGYFAHSNDAGGYLAMCALAMCALAAAAWRSASRGLRRAIGVVLLLVAGFIAYPIALTGSKSALVAGACGMAFAGAVIVLRRAPWFTVRRAWAAGWAGALIACGAVVGHGLYHGGLPGASLDFRWGYWSSSARMIAAQPWRGVGMSNFGRHYPRYKTARDVEDVSDPHNPLVRAAAEWGVPAAAALVLLLMSASWEMASPRRAPPADGWQRHGWRPWGIGLALAAVIAVGRAVLVGAETGAYFVVAGLTPALVWLLVYALGSAGSMVTGRATDDDIGAARVWIGAAALAFLVHCMVSTTLFTAGAMAPLVALYAIGRCGAGGDDARGGAGGRERAGVPAMALGVLLVIGVGAYFWLEVVPTWRSTAQLNTARRLAWLDGPPAGGIKAAYESAVAVDAWDATAADEMARWLASSVRPGLQDSELAARRLDEAVEAARVALRRDPQRAVLYRQLARLHVMSWQVSGRGAAAFDAIAAFRRATELSPSRPEGFVELGEMLEWAAGDERVADEWQGGVRALLSEADGAYRRALELDAARPAGEEIRRFSAEQVEEFERRLLHIEATMRALQ